MPERRFDLWITFDQELEKAAQAQEFRIENGADAQLTLDCIAHRGRGAFDIGGAGQGSLGQGQQCLTVAGQGQAMGGAGE